METVIQPSLWMVLPFVLLLAAIAMAPLWLPNWWGNHYPKVVFGLGALVVGYYLIGLHATAQVLDTTAEYIKFIALIGSLFVVSGGIHIRVKGETTPGENALFLVAGSLIANLLGTTGASMLLIRPWLHMNKYRLTGHHVVFFIFIISNVGGCLTPIGDPPLFLGYLQGIPFWWVASHCWPMWALGVAILVAMFYVVDYRNYLRAPKVIRTHLTEPHDHWRVEGLANLFFLGVILGSVFIRNPPFLREALMLLAAAGSYWTTRSSIHEANHFNFHPIREVAILFIGIFATMMPALDWLKGNAAQLGSPTLGAFFWGSGLLSSVLDNAPTYLTFLSTALGMFNDPESLRQLGALLQNHGAGIASLAGPHAEQIKQAFLLLQQHHGGVANAEEMGVALLLVDPAINSYIVAVSVGSVFFGANTYIGNGPNFMVKAIADQQKVHTPSFLGYVFKYTLPYMLPMLLIVWWVFFRK